jgi:peptidoglycan/xylan/chitin deacetylase (PgdA/CDA1 family)
MNTILLYHGVTTAKSWGIENYSGKHMPVEEFRRQMEIVARDYKPISLRDLASYTRHGQARPDWMAITFDDSYKNVIDNAVPILEALNIPATFFIATGFPGTKRRYWTDRLEHIYNLTGGDVDDLERLKKKYKALNRYGLPDEAGMEVAGLALARGCVMDNGNEIPNYQNMTWDDVRMLDRHPLFDVGGHTVNHSILSHLSSAYRRDEINNCLSKLLEELGHPVNLFSYPEGQEQHFNNEVIDDLKRAGVTICPTAIPGPNKPGTDPFHLRRYMPGFDGQPFPLEEVPTCA